MHDDDMKKFLAIVAENYRFTTTLDMEILGRVSAELSLAEAEAILARVRAGEAEPARLSLPAFAARARATIEHRNLKSSTPKRLIDWVRQELGRDGCDENGEEIDGLACVEKYFGRAWATLKESPESFWRNRMRGMIRTQARAVLRELDWDENEADEVAAGIVEMPYERPAQPICIGAGLQV